MAYGTMYKHVHWYIPHYFPRHCRRRVVGLALVAGGVVLVVRIVNYIRERKERAKQEKDVVYVYTYQRPLHVPNASSQGLKLETWLRMSEIPHEVKFGMCYHSRMGHDPFVVINGEEIRDFILDRLAAHFRVGGAEEELDEEAKGKGVAIERMLDNHTGWAIAMQSHVYKGRELLKSLGFPFPLAMLVGCHIRKYFLQAAYAHGIGRYSREEIGQLRSEDIRALSRLLGDKSYMLGGDKPTKVDAAVFGHLAQIVYWPNMEFPEMALLQGEAKNVHDYIDRIRAEVWPDWNERCRSAMPSNR